MRSFATEMVHFMDAMSESKSLAAGVTLVGIVLLIIVMPIVMYKIIGNKNGAYESRKLSNDTTDSLKHIKSSMPRESFKLFIVLFGCVIIWIATCLMLMMSLIYLLFSDHLYDGWASLLSIITALCLPSIVYFFGDYGFQ